MTNEDLLDRMTQQTLVLMYRDLLDVDDILTDDLAGAIFNALVALEGVDRAVEMLDLIGVPAP